MRNITFINSEASFFSVQQVQLVDPLDTSSYEFLVTNCTATNNVLSSKDSLIELGQINYIHFHATFNELLIARNVLQLGTLLYLQMNSEMMLIYRCQIIHNGGQFALLVPASSDPTNPLLFYITNTLFYDNFAKADALIQLTTNSILYAQHTDFIENYSIGRGAVVFADYQMVYAKFFNCTIIRNYAYQGGVFYIQYSSQIEVSNTTITENFAVTGGVAYVNNDGFIKINNHTRIFKNYALNTCFLFLINTQFASFVDSITITQNDQINPLIKKQDFLGIKTDFKHMKAIYFLSMQNISDKVQRTIDEIVDSAVYAIKAGVNFTNTRIYNNDVFLSASTESTVSFVNCNISDINSTGKVLSAVSSTIELFNFNLTNINYTMPADTSQNFYKISVVNQSILRTLNVILKDIMGLLLYVSGSNLIIEKTNITMMSNDDTQNSLFSIDTSQVYIHNTLFNQIKSFYYSPIFTFQQNTQVITRSIFSNFDKTLFAHS